MDIAEFIEQDILIFLDDRLDSKPEASGRTGAATQTIFITKDYEKDLLAALSQGNVVVAKQTLNALKDELEICPPGPDKEHLKALLLSLYEKFKDYIDAHHLSITDPELGLRTDPAQQPKAAAAPPIAAVAQPAPVPAAPPVQGPAPVESPPNTTVQAPAHAAQAPAALQQVNALQQDIEQALQKQDLERAMQSYRQAKELLTAQGMPQETTLQFITLFGRIKQLAVERRIHAVKQQPTAPSQHAMPATAVPAAPSTPPRPAHSIDHDLLLQLEREKRALDTTLHHGDLAGAATQYRRMRAIVQQMSDPAVARPAAEKLQRIFEIIGSMQKHAAHNERRLSTVMP